MGRSTTGIGTGIESNQMMDLLFIGVVILFFVVSGLYVRFCEKL
jgi:hypothetical protein